VPFLKFSRDKRGYENFYLIEPPSGGRNNPPRGKARPRVLFWFRTPPQVKVGREPFSDDVRKMVEAQNPGMTFDWPRIMATPIPPPDADHWRERRRAEKAARRAEREADAEAVADAPEPAIVAVGEAVTEVLTEHAIADGSSVEAEQLVQYSVPAETAVETSDAQGAAPPERRRRRRRRGRRGRPGQPGVTGPPVTQTAAEADLPELDAPVEPETPPSNEV
jgi:hypothetical protein